MFFRKNEKAKVSLGKKLKEAREKDKAKKNGLDEDDDEPDLLAIIELVTKSTKIDVKDIKFDLGKLIETMPTINELKAEIKDLKQELKEANDRNWQLINKLVDKPAAPSAAATYAAAKLAEAQNANKSGSTTNSTAGPKGKLP